MPIEDRIADLKKGSLRFDCARLDLVQIGCHEPITFRGMGYVEQDTDGRLSFKLFSTEVENTDAFSQLQASLDALAGQLYSPENYYELTATAADGTVWKARDILPECSWAIHSKPIVTGKMNSIRTSEARRKSNNHSLSVHIFEDLELPIWPLREGVPVKFEAANCKFEVSKTEQEVLVKAISKEPLPDDFSIRIQEAIKFLSAKAATIRAVANSGPHGSSWELKSASRLTIQTSMSPPLCRTNTEFLEHGWHLFRQYLDFVTSSSTAGYWNHVTYHVHNAAEASGNSMDAWAVGVSVAVEGLANLIPVPTEGSKKKLIKEFQSWVLPQVKDSPQFSSLHDRLNGLLGMMNNPRVQDRLMPLALRGRVTSDYVKAWSDLRNKHVHPRAKDLQKLSDGDIQGFLDLIYKVTTLMYEIVFYLIEYDGPYQDFGRHGFPIKTFPQPMPGGPNSS
jgi:hypothetical protein